MLEHLKRLHKLVVLPCNAANFFSGAFVGFWMAQAGMSRGEIHILLVLTNES